MIYMKLRRVAKIIIFASKQIVINYYLFFRQNYFFIPYGEGIYGFICMK